MKGIPKDLVTFKASLAQDFGDLFQGGRDIFLVRSPARLDVMGGIADYSGSLILQYPLDRAITLAAQQRDDQSIVIHSLGLEKEGLNPHFSFPMAEFYSGKELRSYESLREYLQRDPKTRWAAYLLGVFLVLLREGGVGRFPRGLSIGLSSTIPLGAGIGSSGALEVATMTGIAAAYNLKLDALLMARFCQKAENQVVGAPCGIMDQATSLSGLEGHFLALRCQPYVLVGYPKLAEGFMVAGIDSRVKHSVGGTRYTDTRIGAFMGHKIILQHLLSQGHQQDPYRGYLANISPEEFNRSFRQLLPTAITGAEFLAKYGPTIDPVTTIDLAKTYHPASRAEHPIYENARVQRFIELLEEERRGDADQAVREAGRLMYGSHWSYSRRCGLGAPETDLIVRMVREAGPTRGLYGARITGGGSGGTVAVLAREGEEAALEQITERYHQKTGLMPNLFLGSSPGAIEIGYQIARLEGN